VTCAERGESIFLLAGGVLDPNERTELEAHLATGCPACEEALDRAQEGLAALALSLSPVAPPERVKDRLLARAREEAPVAAPERGRAHHPRARARGGRLRFAAALGGASLAAAALAGVAVWGLVARPLAAERARLAAAYDALAEEHERAKSEVETLRADLEEQDAELVELEERMEQSSEALRLVAAPAVITIDLAASAQGSEARGRVFWDEDYRCYFRALGLDPLPPEQRYVLWMLAPDGRVHAAGSFEPDASGEATVYTRLPRDFRPVVRTVVTVEMDPSGEQPAGTIVLAGDARPAPLR
jgi:anti-sigma-K factor RskA